MLQGIIYVYSEYSVFHAIKLLTSSVLAVMMNPILFSLQRTPPARSQRDRIKGGEEGGGRDVGRVLTTGC